MSDDPISRLTVQVWLLQNRLERLSPPGLVFSPCGDLFRSCDNGHLYTWDEIALLADRRDVFIVPPRQQAGAEKRGL